jgi:hypothetical protein
MRPLKHAYPRSGAAFAIAALYNVLPPVFAAATNRSLPHDNATHAADGEGIGKRAMCELPAWQVRLRDRSTTAIIEQELAGYHLIGGLAERVHLCVSDTHRGLCPPIIHSSKAWVASASVANHHLRGSNEKAVCSSMAE